MHGHVAARGGVRAGHGDEWDDAGAAGDQLDGRGLTRSPHEPSAEWPAQLDRVTEFEVVDEEGGDLAIGQTVDAEFDLRSRSSAGDGVRADSLIPVGCGEPDIDVLPRIVSWPVGYGEGDAPRGGGGGMCAQGGARAPAAGRAGHA